MNRIVELADEFIEGLYDGSILYYDLNVESLPNGTTWVSHVDQHNRLIVDGTRTSLNAAIHDYLIDQDEKDKVTTANIIYNCVLILRRLGVIQNNPDSLKELGFYKQGYYDESKRSADLHQKLKDAYNKIDELQRVVESQQKSNPLSK